MTFEIKNQEVIKVEFYGESIEAVEKDDRIWVSLKKLCQNMGIKDLNKQYKKVQQDPTFEGGYVLMATPSNGGVQQTFMLDLEFLPFWLGSIQINRVRDEEVKQKLVLYKRECVRVLRDHFFGSKQEDQKQEIGSGLDAMALQNNLLMQSMQAVLQQGQMLGNVITELKATQREAYEAKESAVAAKTQAEQAIGIAKQANEKQEAFVEGFRRALPIPTAEVSNRTERSYLVERMQMIGHVIGDYRGCWRELYKEFKHREQIDLKRRSKNSNGKSKLDIAEELGVIGKLYALSFELWDNIQGK